MFGALQPAGAIVCFTQHGPPSWLLPQAPSQKARHQTPNGQSSAARNRDLQAGPCREQGRSAGSMPGDMLHSLSEGLPAEIQAAHAAASTNLRCSGSSTLPQAAGRGGAHTCRAEGGMVRSPALRASWSTLEGGGLEGMRRPQHLADPGSEGGARICLGKCDSANGQSRKEGRAEGVEQHAERGHEEGRPAGWTCFGEMEEEQAEDESAPCW